MKAKRRQELKTNDLAQAIEDLGNFFKQWGMYVVVGASAIIIAIVISAYMRNARAAAMGQGYADLRAASAMFTEGGERKSDDEIRQNLDRIAELAHGAQDESFRLDALMRQGTLSVGLAEAGEDGIETRYLSDGRTAYQEVIDKYAHSTLRYGRALYGMFQIEADEFAVDEDPAHRDRAVGYLEKLRDDARFNGTPLQTIAVDMLNDLDSVFGAVKFANAPAPSPSPLPAPAAELITTTSPGFANLSEAATPKDAAPADTDGDEQDKSGAESDVAANNGEAADQKPSTDTVPDGAVPDGADPTGAETDGDAAP